MKRSLLLCLVLILFGLHSHAVLKEQNIDNTLSILRTELTDYYNNLERQSGFIKEQQEQVRNNLFSALNRSNQNSLMLYSQKSDYIFDLTYACHEATVQYHEFQKSVLPFRKFIDKTSSEIARYDSLINNLSTMSTVTLSERAQIDRNVCLTLAVNIRRTLRDNRDQLNDYVHIYETTEKHLKNLNDYANRRYSDIQSNIFSNGGENYLSLLSNLGTNLRETGEVVNDKYVRYRKVHSDWDVSSILYLFGSLFAYGLFSLLINFFVIRVLMPRRFRTEEFMAKRTCIIMAASVVLLAFILGIIHNTTNQNFLIMASNLLVEYTWLLGVILISLLLRLDGKQIRSAFLIYSPLIVVGFLVISFRIVLIPNHLVNLILPPILLACTVWQWVVIRRHNHNIPRSDVFYTYISLVVFIASVICSWLGYTLLSVQVLIWWVMQLTCVLTITCVVGWLESFAKRKHYNVLPITKTWHFRFINDVVLRTLSVFSVLISIYWASKVFNLGDTTWMIFNKNFIESPNFTASILTIAQVINLYFIFDYANRTIKDLVYMYFEQKDPSSAASKMVMARNVIQIFVWGIWLLISLNILHVSNTWLVVVSGGLSTGIGFASKDILENIYYGISLMAGRVKVGDYIVCDGTRGKVSSISYTSTMIEATDGSVIAFTNSQLFTKNYKNLTKNHGYELAVLDVGVAYGTDIKRCKELLVDAIKKLKITDPSKPPRIVLKEFGDSSVNLKILVWVNVLTQYGDCGTILECVYNTLNANNIEIPFPQRDLHIINSDSE
ncbi:MAG: mechanosensitive ion channel [Prevotella sp.]|nr:mechanosensitive ion channel [Prevotella sp.]